MSATPIDPVWKDLAPLMSGAKAPDMSVEQGRALRAIQLLESSHRLLGPAPATNGKGLRFERQELRRKIRLFVDSSAVKSC